MKLAIITTHPIQYNAPLFEKLAECEPIDLKVFYSWGQIAEEKYDPSFGKNIKWDIPLLDGYEYLFVKNTSNKPGSHHFGGIKNPTLIKEIENWKADIVLVYGWAFNSHLKAMRYFKGKIPVWFRGDSTLVDYDIRLLKDIRLTNILNDIKQLAKFKLRKLFLTWVYNNIDKAFYVGTNNKEYYLTHGIKNHQLVYAPHAIDNDRFTDNESNTFEQKAEKWRQNLGISNNDFTILFCGKFEQKKNPLLLIQAVNLHNQLHIQKNIRLLIVGNGKLENQLQKQSPTDGSIIFLPFQNQTIMPVIYRLANVYCLPSQGPGETWGLAVNEALACGRPVLVSDKVGCAIDLIHSENGLVFKSKNIESLNYAILDMMNKKFNTNEIRQSISNHSFQNIINAITSECLGI